MRAQAPIHNPADDGVWIKKWKQMEALFAHEFHPDDNKPNPTVREKEDAIVQALIQLFQEQYGIDLRSSAAIAEARRLAHPTSLAVKAPTWFRGLDARRHQIAMDIERIEASPLASRLVDVPRLKRLITQWPKDEHAAEKRMSEYRFALARGVHVGRFVRWVEGGNQ